MSEESPTTLFAGRRDAHKRAVPGCAFRQRRVVPERASGLRSEGPGLRQAVAERDPEGDLAGADSEIPAQMGRRFGPRPETLDGDVLRRSAGRETAVGREQPLSVDLVDQGARLRSGNEARTQGRVEGRVAEEADRVEQFVDQHVNGFLIGQRCGRFGIDYDRGIAHAVFRDFPCFRRLVTDGVKHPGTSQFERMGAPGIKGMRLGNELHPKLTNASPHSRTARVFGGEMRADADLSFERQGRIENPDGVLRDACETRVPVRRLLAGHQYDCRHRRLRIGRESGRAPLRQIETRCRAQIADHVSGARPVAHHAIRQRDPVANTARDEGIRCRRDIRSDVHRSIEFHDRGARAEGVFPQVGIDGNAGR